MPTPKLGGLAILVGVLVAGLLFLPDGPGQNGDETRAILIGAVAIALVGVIDDIFDLPAGLKLLGQIGAAIDPGFGGRHGRRVHAAVRRRRRARRASTLIGSIDLGEVLTVLGHRRRSSTSST